MGKSDEVLSQDKRNIKRRKNVPSNKGIRKEDSKGSETQKVPVPIQRAFKLFWVSDSPTIPTGYAQVTRNVLNTLAKIKMPVAAMGFQYMGRRMTRFELDDTPTQEYSLFPNGAGANPYEAAKNMVDIYVNMFHPEYLCFLCDMFMINWILEKNYKDTKLMMYFPFDSETVYEKSDEVLRKMDIRVAMSKFAKNLLQKETGLDSYYIPHGVDTHLFRPLPKSVRSRLREENGFEDKFIVGSVARNQSRKVIPRLCQAFAKFAENKDDVILLLHTDPHDHMGTNLFDMINRLKIKDKVKFTGMGSFLHGIEIQRVNAVYNMIDVHALSTTGEGFGLPIIESMAVGVPNICTDYTTARELIGKDGELVKVQTCITGQLNTARALVDIDDYVKKLDKLYYHPNLRKRYGKRGRERILKNYSWDVVLRKWIKLLEEGEL
ncbi:MAG: glycosyltransferase family 4 protein [Candidatus Heimdallarchaeota archaeon]